MRTVAPANDAPWTYPGLMRLVSLLPSATEIVYALGVGEDGRGGRPRYQRDDPGRDRRLRPHAAGGRRGSVHPAREGAGGPAARADTDPGPVPGVRAAVRSCRGGTGLPGVPG